MISLDAIDRRILERLQHDGRLSNADLAEQVGLSSSPCWRRVKALEEAGVIKGYAAQVDAKSVGLSVNVFMSVSLTTQTEKALKDFERAAAERRRRGGGGLHHCDEGRRRRAIAGGSCGCGARGVHSAGLGDGAGREARL